MAYARVLAAALLCYAALGAVLRALPGHLTISAPGHSRSGSPSAPPR